MEDKSIENFSNKFVNDLKSLDGMLIGQKMEEAGMRLSKDNKNAWLNHLADQYLKKEELDIAPEELSITTKDIIYKLAQREISKLFGK